MSAAFQLCFNDIALDPVLLRSSYKVQTKWVVLTGAPNSGKTTLIKCLMQHGFRTSPELARVYIANEIAKGITLEEQEKDMYNRQRGVNNFVINAEAQMPANELIFLDRGFPDALAYSRIVGLDPNEFLCDCFQHRYAAVFCLERFTFQDDGVRFENEAGADFLQKWLISDYFALGYDLVRVPILPVEERLDFILSRLPG